MPEEQTAGAPLAKSTHAEDILAPAADAAYQETDVFAWANNLVQYKDEIKISLFLLNKNNVVYRVSRSGELEKQLEPLFIDQLLEYVLEGAEKGLVVRGFEQAEAEENVLQRTRLKNVDKLQEVLYWLKTSESEIEPFVEEEHDIKRIKGVLARCSHPDLPAPFYVIKQLPASNIMKGSASWMLRNNVFKKFDADAALRIPSENHLLLLDQDLYVFNQAKLKSLFGYDAKEASIAQKKVNEILENFRLSFADGLNMQELIKGKRGIIKKLQKVEPSLVKQDELLQHAEELGIELLQDDSGAIIIMDGKDMDTFVNLLNDDYIESPLTGLRYEIQRKRLLKPQDDELLAAGV